MIYSLQPPSDQKPWDYQVPGLYLRRPVQEDYAVHPTPLGVPGFLGYARLRPLPASSPGLEVEPFRWPVWLSSLEEARLRLETPSWGLLMPALEAFFANGGRRCQVVGLSWETAHTLKGLLPPHLERDQGLAAFGRTQGIELILAPDLFLVPPGCRAPRLEELWELQRALIDFSAGLLPGSDHFGGLALLDCPPGLSPIQALRYVDRLREHPKASFGACFYPWVRTLETPSQAMERGRRGLEGAPLGLLPPSPLVAGQLSRLSEPDAGTAGMAGVSVSRGPHQAAANRRLEGLAGLERKLSGQDREVLLRYGVNCLVGWAGDGFRLWGDRTLSRDPLVAQIMVRRILSFVQRSIQLSSRWVVFEPNTWNVWLQLTAQVEIFLESLLDAGVVVGSSPADAFFVKCDSETNPPEAVAEGRILMQVLVRPARATEVMVVEITHRTDQPGTSRNTGG